MNMLIGRNNTSRLRLTRPQAMAKRIDLCIIQSRAAAGPVIIGIQEPDRGAGNVRVRSVTDRDRICAISCIRACVSIGAEGCCNGSNAIVQALGCYRIVDRPIEDRGGYACTVLKIILIVRE